MGRSTFPEIITEGLRTTKFLFSSHPSEFLHQKEIMFGCFFIPTPNHKSQMDAHDISMYGETWGTHCLQTARFSTSACPLYHSTGKAFGSHNQSPCINSEFSKRPYLPEIMIKESWPSNITPLHKTLLALQKPSRTDSLAYPAQTLNLTLA